MISIAYASGDYRDLSFPLVATDSADTVTKAVKKAKKHKTAEFAFIWEEGNSTITEIIKVK